AGFSSFREPIADDKVRGKPEKFAEHYQQAALFYNSQTAVEKAHILRGFRFELTKVQTPAIRERVVATLANVDAGLAKALARELGIAVPKPLPKAVKSPPKPEVTASPSLSLMAHPGNGTIRTRRIAILVADGVDGESAQALHEGLTEQGAVPRFVGIRLGTVTTAAGDTLQAEVTLETMPSVLFDAVAVLGGKDAVVALGNVGHALEFIKDQYRHAKPILALGEGADLVENAGASATLPSGQPDPGMIVAKHGRAREALPAFVKAIARHRHHEREADPPPV
ncbi:MAG: catalase-related domain-containing protein, partial [Myxococcales bacterium]